MFDSLNVEGQEGKGLLIAMGHGTVQTDVMGNSISFGIPKGVHPSGAYVEDNMETKLITLRFDSVRSVRILINNLKGVRDGMIWDLEREVRNNECITKEEMM